jgi:hypothetical protein
MSSDANEPQTGPQQEVQSPPTSNGENGSPKPKKAKPLKPLPPDRLVFNKQIDCLRGYAAKSGQEGKAVRLADVAEIVKMHQNTVTLVNPFFSALGLIQKGESGGYIPAPEVLSYARTLEFNPQTAGQKLAPIISTSWFAQELMPKLAFRSMDEQEAMGDLGSVAGVGQESRSQLKVLLDYLELAGLIQRDGTRITKVSTQSGASEPQKQGPFAPSDHHESAVRKSAESEGQPGGSMRFQVDIRVDMAEVATWKPERIAAFFNGMAQVLAAKRGTDGSS